MPAPIDIHRQLAASLPAGTPEDPVVVMVDGYRVEYRGLTVNDRGFLVCTARIDGVCDWDDYWFWNPPSSDRLGRLHVVNRRLGFHRALLDAILGNREG